MDGWDGTECTIFSSCPPSSNGIIVPSIGKRELYSKSAWFVVVVYRVVVVSYNASSPEMSSVIAIVAFITQCLLGHNRTPSHYVTYLINIFVKRALKE